jgi:hypothetical protein
MTWRKALIHALSYLPYAALDFIGKRTQPWDDDWTIVSAAWLVKDRRGGM